MKKNGTLVMVLNDGETYTDCKGSRLVYIPEGTEDPDSFVESNFENGILVSPRTKTEAIEFYGDILIPDFDNLDCESLDQI